MQYGFGIDLGGTTVKIAWFDDTGNMLTKWEIPTRTQEGGKYILPDIAARFRRCSAATAAEGSFPGFISHRAMVSLE